MSQQPASPGFENLDSLVTVLDLLRLKGSLTRLELALSSKLGRTVIAQRVSQLIELGLVREGALSASTGGRAARQLCFREDAGHLLVAAFGATGMSVGLLDLRGRLINQYVEACDIAAGPHKTLDRLDVLFDELLATRTGDSPAIWGIGIGLPGPVEFASAVVSPPIMPGWDGYPIRERLTARYRAPVWVDNEVNTMALGELRAGSGAGQADLVYLKIGTGIGAGLISGGRLHRGAQGCAGDIGHMAIADGSSVVCRCGNIGCPRSAGRGSCDRARRPAGRRTRTEPLPGASRRPRTRCHGRRRRSRRSTRRPL